MELDDVFLNAIIKSSLDNISELGPNLPYYNLTTVFKASFDSYRQSSSKTDTDPFHIPIAVDLF